MGGLELESPHPLLIALPAPAEPAPDHSSSCYSAQYRGVRWEGNRRWFFQRLSHPTDASRNVYSENSLRQPRLMCCFVRH